jgi:hypothetical protein
MPVHISDVEDVVEPLSPDFDRDDTTTENLENLKAELEDDIEAISELISSLDDFIFEAQDRLREIEDILAKHEGAGDVLVGAQAIEGDESEAVRGEAVG